MAAPAFRAAGTFASSSTADITPGLPAGYQAGDILLLFYEGDPNFFTADLSSATYAAGWEVIWGGQNDSAITSITMAWLRAPNTSVAAPVIQRGTSDHISAIVHAYSGAVASGDAIATFDGLGNFGSPAGSGDTGTAVSLPAVAASDTANELIVAAISYSSDTATAQASGWANANLTSVTERSDNATTQGDGGGIAVATGTKATAGTVGTTTATLAGSQAYAGIVFGIRPPGAISGTGGVTIPAVVGTAAASLAVQAAGNSSIAAITATGAAKVSLAGVGALTIGPVTSTGAATLSLGAAGSVQIGPVAASAAAALAIAAVGTVTIDPVLGSGQATLGVDEGHLGPVIGSGAIALAIAGTAASGIGQVTSAGIVSTTLSAAASAVIGPVVSAGQTATTISAAGSALVGAVTGPGAAAVAIRGQGSVLIGPVAGAGFMRPFVLTVTPPGRIASFPTSLASGRIARFPVSLAAGRIASL